MWPQPTAGCQGALQLNSDTAHALESSPSCMRRASPPRPAAPPRLHHPPQVSRTCGTSPPLSQTPSTSPPTTPRPAIANRTLSGLIILDGPPVQASRSAWAPRLPCRARGLRATRACMRTRTRMARIPQWGQHICKLSRRRWLLTFRLLATLHLSSIVRHSARLRPWRCGSALLNSAQAVIKLCLCICDQDCACACICDHAPVRVT
jgi:hypothetical protein